MATEYSRRDYDKDVSQDRIDRQFDAVDTKGRRFGAMVRKFTCEFARATSTSHNAEVFYSRPEYQRECGVTHYGFRPHATRNGQGYGALQPEKIFATEAERDAAIEKYFATAERGALKNKARAA